MPTEHITIVGLSKLRKRFENLGEGIVSYEVLDKIGNYLSGAIKVRTLAGKDVEGNPFEPYTPRYRLFRQKAGKQTTPNLYFHGTMLGALTYAPELSKEQVKVFFMEGTRAGESISSPAKAFYLQDKRPFFGASADNIEKITEIYQDYVRGLLRG